MKNEFDANRALASQRSVSRTSGVIRPRPLLARMAQAERRAKAERVARIVVRVGAVLIAGALVSALLA